MALAILCAHASVTFHFVQVLIQPQRSQSRGCAIIGALPSCWQKERGRGFGKICIVMEAAGFFIYAH